MRLSLFISATLLIASASLANARPLLETHFHSATSTGCFVRTYSAAHLAKHPDQLVRYISLSPVPNVAPAGQTLLNLTVNLRGSDYFPSSFVYCRPKGDALSCAMEGDAGRFTLSGREKGQVLLTVGRDGLVFEGQNEFVTISGTSGDDRTFLIATVSLDLCS